MVKAHYPLVISLFVFAGGCAHAQILLAPMLRNLVDVNKSTDFNNNNHHDNDEGAAHLRHLKRLPKKDYLKKPPGLGGGGGSDYQCQAGGKLPNKATGGACSKYRIIPRRDDASYEITPIIRDLTYDDLAYYQSGWTFDRPGADLPLLDTDGSFNEQDSGIDGVHFLESGFLGQTICRETRVSKDDILFVAVTGYLTIHLESMLPDAAARAAWDESMRYTTEWIGVENPNKLQLQEQERILTNIAPLAFRPHVDVVLFLDGCPLDVTHDFSQHSEPYYFDNTDFLVPFQAAVTQGKDYILRSGFYVALEPLDKGEHILRMVMTIPGFNYALQPAFGFFLDENNKVFDLSLDLEYRLIVE